MADKEQQNENPEAEGEEGEGEEQVGGKKKLLIIILAVLILAGGGAGLFLSGVLGGGEDAEMAEEAADAEEAAKKEGEMAEGEYTPVYMELPPFLVNINSGTKRTSFLKMKVTLEMAGEEALAQATAMQPKLLDAFNTYLRELRTSDLSGSAGIYRLRQELLTRTNKALHPVEVKDILFSEIVVQ